MPLDLINSKARIAGSEESQVTLAVNLSCPHAFILARASYPGYSFIGEQIKAAFEKATWAAAFWRVGWNFRPAFCTNLRH
jgi:hypothetical protein